MVGDQPLRHIVEGLGIHRPVQQRRRGDGLQDPDLGVQLTVDIGRDRGHANLGVAPHVLLALAERAGAEERQQHDQRKDRGQHQQHDLAMKFQQPFPDA